ncbi:MAG: TetR family transcriptional regulator [Myxococcota bacterium]
MNLRAGIPGRRAIARCTKEEAAETRERLLDAALDVFHADGVARPSLTKVAEHAGLTRGAIYGHFENKADLFAALCDRTLLPAEALAEARDAGADDPLATLRAWCVTVLRDMVAHRDRRRLLEVIFHKCEMVEEAGGIWRRRQQSRQLGRSHVTELVRLAVAAGQLPAGTDVPFAGILVHDAVTGLLSQWLLDPEAYDLPARAERSADAMVALLLALPGG